MGSRTVRDDMAYSPDRPAAPSWLVWTALWIVYIVWGSTYLAIRITVQTLPPFLAGGVRFLIAGGVLYLFLLFRKGPAAMKVTGREVAAAAFVGIALLLGGNGMVMLAEQQVPSGLASLLIATVPLWVILFRKLTGDKIARGTLVGVAVGFAGVALLVLPGDRPDGVRTIGIVMMLVAAVSWAIGTFTSSRLSLPKDPFVSTAIQMLFGGVAGMVAGAATGEFGGIDFGSFSTSSILALVYLITIGSWLAFTAYVWLLQNAPVSKVATYAYVNPVIAIFLGWLVLSEQLTVSIVAGAAIIVASVAVIVRKESASNPAVETEEPAPAALVGADAS
ncbi:MAG TPA: EamA family transporter [Actinomycetota bacterium]|nr:EamA family transporter [Actinomycetota bacterium]